MTICNSMKNAVMKRVNEGKDIKQIGEDLCDGLKYPQKKIIAIIKEIKGKEYLNENKKRLNYRGGGGAGKPKAKKTELQNILPQAEPNLSESDTFKIKFTQLINECQESQPNDWKEIILKCIEDFEAVLKTNESNKTSSAPNVLVSETTQTLINPVEVIGNKVEVNNNPLINIKNEVQNEECPLHIKCQKSHKFCDHWQGNECCYKWDILCKNGACNMPSAQHPNSECPHCQQALTIDYDDSHNPIAECFHCHQAITIDYKNWKIAC